MTISGLLDTNYIIDNLLILSFGNLFSNKIDKKSIDT
jgi:hypothetical protein